MGILIRDLSGKGTMERQQQAKKRNNQGLSSASHDGRITRHTIRRKSAKATTAEKRTPTKGRSRPATTIEESGKARGISLGRKVITMVL
jgi:hypothetical protein